MYLANISSSQSVDSIPNDQQLGPQNHQPWCCTTISEIIQNFKILVIFPTTILKIFTSSPSIFVQVVMLTPATIEGNMHGIPTTAPEHNISFGLALRI